MSAKPAGEGQADRIGILILLVSCSGIREQVRPDDVMSELDMSGSRAKLRSGSNSTT